MKKTSRGFTLVELLVAMGLFMVVMTVALGAVLSILNANRKAQAESSLLGNLNLALETMSREMRFSKNYHCADSGNLAALTTPQNCPGGNTLVSFLSTDGTQITYELSGTALLRSTDNGATFLRVTSPEITIENLKFYVLGANPAPDTAQPKALIALKGYAGVSTADRTEFSLQTVVSQRQLDNGH